MAQGLRHLLDGESRPNRHLLQKGGAPRPILAFGPLGHADEPGRLPHEGSGGRTGRLLLAGLRDLEEPIGLLTQGTIARQRNLGDL